MIKYWDKARVQRVREREKRRDEEQLKKLREELRTAHLRKPYPDLFFEALALPIRRAMIRRLREKGAMSVSYLAEPFRITLPAAMKHMEMLEAAGIITTHKRGRIRFCVFNPSAFDRICMYLKSKSAFLE
ncbi:ArsR family transcriptional regulator [Candidatus Parcubacteria bacterium]|nr:MAG: ArsR family transcriptional regulator [Candidatus Parcubacteria bacterium]